MRIQRSSGGMAWIVAVVLLGAVIVLSPAYLHFTKSGPEFSSTPDAPLHPHSDATCDKLYATYQAQIDDIQQAIVQANDKIGKTQDPGDIADLRAHIAKLGGQAADLSTQGMQARDDCYVKVANWETDQKGAQARKLAANATSAPLSYNGRPEAAPRPAMAMAAVAQPASTPAHPVRAYIYGQGPSGPAVQQSVASTETPTAAPRPHVARHARSSGHAYAWAHKARRRPTVDEDSIQMASYGGPTPRLEVVSYDRVLVASSDGVMRIPAAGSDIQLAATSAEQPVAAGAVTHRRSHLHHYARWNARRHAHKTLASARAAPVEIRATSAQAAPVTAQAPDTATAPIAAPAVVQPVSTTVQAPAVRSTTPAPAVVRTTSGTDPPVH